MYCQEAASIRQKEVDRASTSVVNGVCEGKVPREAWIAEPLISSHCQRTEELECWKPCHFSCELWRASGLVVIYGTGHRSPRYLTTKAAASAWQLEKVSWEAGSLAAGLLVDQWQGQAYSSDETRFGAVGCQAARWKHGVMWTRQ